MLAGECTSKKIRPTYPTSHVISVISPAVEDFQWAKKKGKLEMNREKKKTLTSKSTPCHRLCLQGIEKSLLSKAWPITVSTIDVFTSRNPLTFIFSSIGIMAMSKRGPFATDNITHASRWLEWVDGFDKPTGEKLQTAAELPNLHIKKHHGARPAPLKANKNLPKKTEEKN